MENQIEELKEDLDSEKSARTKAEKQRRELGEVMESVLSIEWAAQWFVRLTPDRAVRVWALAGDIVLRSWAKVKTLYSHSDPLHPGVLMGTGEFNAWGNSAMD